MRCPRYQHENPSGQKFCGACGTPLTANPSGPPAPSYAEITRALSEALEQQKAAAELLQIRSRDLTEALEQQTATSEILRVISGSPTDVQPVFDAIAHSAAHLCDAEVAGVFRYDGELLHFVAHHGLTPKSVEALGRAFPTPLSRGSAAARAVLNAGVEQIPDVHADPDYVLGAAAEATKFRSSTGVPMMRDDVPIGSITVSRTRPGLLPDRQIALLQTFADQAVIAIENVRLFTELEGKNLALTTAHAQVTEALDQQTATSEILRVIASSPTDVQPVFDAIARKAFDLCRAWTGAVYRFDGELIHLAAGHSFSPEALEAARHTFPMPPSRGVATAEAILRRAVVYIPDIREDPAYELHAVAKIFGYLSILTVPMVQDGKPIGAITVTGAGAAAFSERQIELLKTFADQAVIAVENVRLFNETKEALEQQTATAEILRVISSSPTDLQPVMDVVAESAARFCGAANAAILRLEGDVLRLVAQHGPSPSNRPIGAIIPVSRGSLPGRVVLDRQTIHIEDFRSAVVQAEFPETVERTRQTGAHPFIRTILVTPLLREGVPMGVIWMRRLEVQPFTDKQIQLAKTFADQAVIAIENVRLFKELQARNAELTESLEQQTATAEILRVISSSPTDLQPVMDVVAESAARVCGATDSIILRLDGDVLQRVASHGALPVGTDIGHVSRGSVAGRAVWEQRTIHVEDLLALPETEFPDTVARWAHAVHHTFLATPLLREATPLGAILIRRAEVRPFTTRQIELLETFANQAVIAIENVRLFQELEARNRELTEALEQQTATSEILRVIASSPTDLQPVMEAVAENAARVCGAMDSAILRLEGEHLRLVALHGPLRRSMTIGDTAPASRGTVGGRVVGDRRTIHVEDLMAAEAEFPETVSRHRQTGSLARTMLATPLLREGMPLGVIVIARGPAVRPFSAKQIALLETFANQAVIAIENVRLFKELRARTAELTRSVEQLTALGEVSRAVSSTLGRRDGAADRSSCGRISSPARPAARSGSTTRPREEFRLRASHYADARDAAILPAPRRASPRFPRGRG